MNDNGFIECTLTEMHLVLLFKNTARNAWRRRNARKNEKSEKND